MEIIEYIQGRHPKLKIKYNNKEKIVNIKHFKDCRIASILDKTTRRKRTDFKLLIGETMIDEKRNLIIIDRDYKKDKQNRENKCYKYKCIKCGVELWTTEKSLLKGCGCACCCTPPKVLVVGMNDITTTDPWMIPYFQGGYEEAKLYTYNSMKKIYPKCPYCGRVKEKPLTISNLHNFGMGCICKDGHSKISKYIFNVLEQLKKQNKINDFKTEIKYDWNTYKTFDGKEHQASIDFIIEYDNRQIPLEADGGFHRCDNNMTGQKKEEIQYIDKQRDDNCLKYLGEATIRISDENDIKENILNSELNNVFDLTYINWDECEKFSCSNLIKITCEYKKNNPNMTTIEIAEIMKSSDTTIRNRLKIGNELGWCHYDPKEEMLKVYAKKKKNKQ